MVACAEREPEPKEAYFHFTPNPPTEPFFPLTKSIPLPNLGYYHTPSINLPQETQMGRHTPETHTTLG